MVDMSGISWIIVLVSVVAIAIGDVFIKEAAITSRSFAGLFKNPWFLGAVALYVLQVVGFGYLLYSGAKLSWIGIVQTVIYALVVITSGVALFHESLTMTQSVGIGFAVIGVILLNLKS